MEAKKFNVRMGGRPSWKKLYAKQDVRTEYNHSRDKKKRQYRKPKLPCRHCGNVRILRPRQLCWTCYYNPAIAKLYPDTNHWTAGAKLEHSGKNPPLPEKWTNARPGSEEKIQILTGRADRGEQLFHPKDF